MWPFIRATEPSPSFHISLLKANQVLSRCKNVKLESMYALYGLLRDCENFADLRFQLYHWCWCRKNCCVWINYDYDAAVWLLPGSNTRYWRRWASASPHRALASAKTAPGHGSPSVAIIALTCWHNHTPTTGGFGPLSSSFVTGSSNFCPFSFSWIFYTLKSGQCPSLSVLQKCRWVSLTLTWDRGDADSRWQSTNDPSFFTITENAPTLLGSSTHFSKSVTQCCPPSGMIVRISCHWLTHSF